METWSFNLQTLSENEDRKTGKEILFFVPYFPLYGNKDRDFQVHKLELGIQSIRLRQEADANCLFCLCFPLPEKISHKLIISSVCIWLHGTMTECIQPFLHCLLCKIKNKRLAKGIKFYHHFSLGKTGAWTLACLPLECGAFTTMLPEQVSGIERVFSLKISL